MIKKIISLFIILSMIIALNPITMNKSNAATKLNILFIGNSKTYYNNMPTMLSNMLTKSNKEHNYKVLVKGRQTLNFHYEYIKNHQSKIQKEFGEEKLDYIILQEQTETQINKTYKDQNKVIYGDMMTDVKNILILLNNMKLMKAKTVVILNAVWNTVSIDKKKHKITFKDLDKSNKNHEALAKNIKKLGYDCRIAYSGNALKEVNNKMINKKLDLQELFCENDSKHTNQVGSYIEALTLYKAMFKKNLTVQYAGSISESTMEKSKKAYIKIKKEKDTKTKKGFTYHNEKLTNEFDVFDSSSDSCHVFNVKSMPKIKDSEKIKKVVYNMKNLIK